MAEYGVVLPHGSIVFGVVASWRGSEAERVLSISSWTVSLGSLAQRDLGVGRGLMVTRRV
jgi:hypothetical protein